MANKNTNLHKEKKKRFDEFYTTYETIEDEVSHYREQFNGKIVLCNCDNPFKSNFCKFFLKNFNKLGLKRLICTSYEPSDTIQIDLFTSIYECSNRKHGKILDITEIKNGELNISDEFVENYLQTSGVVRELEGDGDFKSKECVENLKICDIVVTNPPFSLFNDFVLEIRKYQKNFLIIGNQNALTYKDIFPLIQNGEIWTGYQFGEMKFRVPSDSEPRSTRYWVDETGQKWRSLGNAMWLTNLDNERRHETLKLIKSFNPEIHVKYDNYDAIHIRNITEIPFDYQGIMGVPITIINRYNSEQFEIIGEANHGSDSKYDIFKPIINGKEQFKRILIRNKTI